MRKLFLFLISLYQFIISPFIHSLTGTSRACRYDVTCSQYARQAIMKHGVFRGGLMALKRLYTCHPFS